jgi:hypothetical protein
LEERERKVEKEDVKRKEIEIYLVGQMDGNGKKRYIEKEKLKEREREIGDEQRNRGKERRNKRWSNIARLFW